MRRAYFITLLILIVTVLILAIASLFVGSAHSLNLKALQEELHKRGDPWIAGKTPLSDLPLSVKRQMCNLRLPKDHTPMRVKKRHPVRNPPSEWDWRDVDGHNWMTSVKNQGGCGSCWDFACMSALEARWKIWNNEPDDWDFPDLSEQFVLSCNPYGYSCGGGMLDIWPWVMDETNGIPDEPCFPYIASNGNCNDRCSDWEERAAPYDIVAWGELGTNADERKEEIMRGPCAVAVTVKEDFFYYLGGVYEPIMGDDLGSDGGKYYNHGVCCCGWNSSGAWLCKNSWGTGNQDWFYKSDAGWFTWMDPLEAGGRGRITVYNKSFACADLKVTSVEKDADWIRFIDPKSFTLTPGDSQVVSVRTDPNVAPGTYETTIRILSNDPTYPSYSVPVTLKVTSGGKSGGESRGKVISSVITLNCYPNPIRKTATIIYKVPVPTHITLNIYDVSGRKVKTIVEEKANSGTHILKTEIKDLKSGIYFVSLKGDKRRVSQKIILTH